MNGSAEDFGRGLAAARASLGRGDRAEAERQLRDAIGAAEHAAVDESELASALNELAGLRRDMDEPREAEALFQRALLLLERMDEPDESSLLTTLTGLGGVLAARGQSKQAERLLSKALAIGERRLGSDHEDLGGLLNDLSRLFLANGAHALAEPLLLRLYDLKRQSKGEDHPESATVLASLASVRQALGRHDEAESMWRRVVAVREATLAPNHFATAMALEHLAEACAARGKLPEALQLLKRATTMRELTLGSGHPSLRIARDRIADLQLQASDDALNGFVEPPTPTHRAPTEPRSADPPSHREPHREPRRVSQRRADGPDGQPRQQQAFVLPAQGGALTLQDQNGARPAQAMMLPARDALLAVQAELASSGAHPEEENGENGEERPHPIQRLGAAAATVLRRSRVPALVTGATATVLLLGVVASRSRAASADRTSEATLDRPRSPSMSVVPAPAPAPAPRPGPAPLATVSATSARESSGLPSHIALKPAVPSETSASRVLSSLSSLSSLAAHLPATRATRATREQHADGDVAPTQSETLALVAPTVSLQLLGNLDSFARAATAPPVLMGEPYKVQLAAEVPKRRSDLGALDGRPELVRARLIGEAPQPKFPDLLRDRTIEGEVVVRFTVDAQGRPVPSSLLVLRTPHDLLTDAVRRVIPGMRFEPAHRANIGAPLEPDQVQMVFQFSSGIR
jgi:TonB family protein